MRRQDIQLRSLARQGDPGACREVGRRYLCGVDGFPHSVATGLGYLVPLTRSGDPNQAEAAAIIAENLALQDIIDQQQEAVLVQAAAGGSANAMLKLGAWRCVRLGQGDEGARWIERAAAAGHAAAREALDALRGPDCAESLAGMLAVLTRSGELDGLRIVFLAAHHARADCDLPRLAANLRTALALGSRPDAELAELIAAAVLLAEAEGEPLVGLAPAVVEAALDLRTQRGDREAAYALGRALCGIGCGVLAPHTLTPGANMRKGVALLMRAADAGCESAWLHLYRVHGDHRHSVANPQMARFCLEKAAQAGLTEARRKLGALLLRCADTLADSEAAIGWLHQAALMGDEHAQLLLSSLVLRLEGEETAAAAAIELVRHDNPWLAQRLQLARRFGLTKLEALCVDPVDGLRPWGLVVGKNPFISQIRLSSARAIPALGAAALDTARRVAAFFGQSAGEAQRFEGDLRRRSLRQRRAFTRHGLDESMFFASASANTLDAMRLGPKWAFRAKEPLQLALAA